MNKETEIRNYFKTIKVSVSNIISLACRIFDFDCFRLGLILSTRQIYKNVDLILKALKASPVLKSQVKNSIFDAIQSYRTQAGMRVKHAPLKHPEKL